LSICYAVMKKVSVVIPVYYNEASLPELYKELREIEDELLKCLRQKKGEYDPETLNQIKSMGGSEIYMKLTTTKIRGAVAWFKEILLPAGDKAWGIEPTPMPELPGWAYQEIAKRLMETGGGDDPEEVTMMRAAEMRDSAVRALNEIARDAAERMEIKIEDQLAEGNWENSMEEFIDDFCTFPCSFLKGPYLVKEHTMKWGDITVATGKVKPIVKEEIKHRYKRVSPFDMYPSADATTIHDGNIIERERYTRKEVFALKGRKGYNDKEIDAVLEEYGRSGLKDWLWRDYERAQLEGKRNWYLRSDGNSIDGLHYYGSAQGLALLEWGLDPKKIDDPLADYEIDAILIGTHVIRAVINKDPMRRRPYKKASYDNVPGSFWGMSIPFLMRDIQRMCNAVARSLSNNLGISSGPQVQINVDRLPVGEPVSQMYPWKIWQTTSDKTGSSSPAINFFQPQSNADELMRVFDFFEKKADDATGIPRYTYGSEKVGGAGRTASGLSMLLNNSAKGIRSAISNIDKGVTKPAIDFKVVLLPAPLGPTRQTYSPSSMDRHTPLKICKNPYPESRFLTSNSIKASV